MLNNVLVSNGSFEIPDVIDSAGGYEYNPANATWSFLGDTGIAHYTGELLLNQGVPDVKQAAFIENGGSVYQVQSISAGTYTLRFYGAQWEGNTMDQQVRVNLRPSGAGVSVKRFVWCGDRICEERDSSGSTVTKRFFNEGEQRIGGSDAGNYYYSRDHLGSIREVTDASGRARARYDYDPYGKSVVVDGNMSVDFGYTGHYFHAPSGLNLTLYRAYNPAQGRWLSRDPLEDAELLEGPNLYAYVENDPVNQIDPDGRFVLVPAIPFIIKGALGTGAAIWLWNQGSSVNQSGEQARERAAYKRRCSEPPPPNLDKCALARWLLQRNRDCAQMREDYSSRWYGGPDARHAAAIMSYWRAAEKLEQWIRENCSCPGK